VSPVVLICFISFYRIHGYAHTVVSSGAPEPRGQLPPALVARGQRGGRQVPFWDETRLSVDSLSCVYLHNVNELFSFITTLLDIT